MRVVSLTYFSRIDRTKRVREARDEAKKEIDAYRKTKEEEFKKFEAEVGSSNTLHLPFICPPIKG